MNLFQPQAQAKGLGYAFSFVLHEAKSFFPTCVSYILLHSNLLLEYSQVVFMSVHNMPTTKFQYIFKGWHNLVCVGSRKRTFGNSQKRNGREYKNLLGSSYQELPMSGGNSWREPAPITGVLRKGVACSHTSHTPFLEGLKMFSLEYNLL